MIDVALTLLALASQPQFADGAPVLRAAAFAGPIAECDDPKAAGWGRAEAYEIPLRMTPPHTRSRELPEQSIETLQVRALAALDGIAIRVSWRDETTDLGGAETEDISTFPDAVAVMFPAGERAKVLPALAMGTLDKPVNIWRWAADRTEAEENIAEGFGQLSAAQGETPVRASGSRTSQGWSVTFSRPYEVAPTLEFRNEDTGVTGAAQRVPIAPGARLATAFAVWNGAYQDRGGRKAVSIWYYVQLPASRSSVAAGR